jgi:hypothetical protein
VSTAGRLLSAIQKSGGSDLTEIASHSRISFRRLEECRDGIRPLESLHVLRPPARGHPRFCVHRSSLLPSLKGNLFLGLNVRVQRNGSGALA